jgi:hypothetical protein
MLHLFLDQLTLSGKINLPPRLVFQNVFHTNLLILFNASDRTPHWGRWNDGFSELADSDVLA